ncbi:phage virion morphogenesis protein [Vibrio cholerae]|uniref:phage virion morphogenesis protein n=1 Tax=Vibrio cholerae TaxID=666 RepID=UPI0005B63CD5|nr:phage virion morphogenesis protein [Vibrio cholerae]EGR1038533.1 virion morphogenesis protein [Vibrio cholerae]EMC4024043.1 phage virion morphogenesis protein [Vibrio cholerae]TXX34563.1 virion morphogenesis protein [Vibrio cholerae]WOQ96112.1 phage virion morphogenesis protein [Vibrio cholerae]GHW67919.1 putative prophage pspph06, virion morphogenesis protein [Vibrio cholerae]
MITIRADRDSQLMLMESLKLLTLPAKKKKGLLEQAALISREKSRSNAAKQESQEGTAWKERKRLSGKKSRKKMLQGIARLMGVISVDEKRAVVGWKVGMTSKIAAYHHSGGSYKMSASKIRAIRGKPDYQAPATKEQARALRKEGFKARINGRKRRPTNTWVMENLKQGQAGLIIRLLRNSKQVRSWDIKAETRQFVQVDSPEILRLYRKAISPSRSK